MAGYGWVWLRDWSLVIGITVLFVGSISVGRGLEGAHSVSVRVAIGRARIGIRGEPIGNGGARVAIGRTPVVAGGARVVIGGTPVVVGGARVAVVVAQVVISGARVGRGVDQVSQSAESRVPGWIVTVSGEEQLGIFLVLFLFLGHDEGGQSEQDQKVLHRLHMGE